MFRSLKHKKRKVSNVKILVVQNTFLLVVGKICYKLKLSKCRGGGKVMGVQREYCCDLMFVKNFIRPEKKKCLFTLFLTDPKNRWKFWVAFFSDIQFCIFKQYCENKSLKIHLNCPKILLCRHRMYMFTPYMSSPDCLMSLI